MIEFIDERLKAWGQWSSQRADGSLGFSTAFQYREPRFDVAHAYCSRPLLDDYCSLTESAVAWLFKRPEYRRVAVTLAMHYRDGLAYTSEQSALILGISKRAYFYRIERGHLEILGYLTERESGRIPQLAAIAA